MKTLQILGTGCPKCRKLAETTEEAAKSLGLEYRMEKVTDIQAIMGFGVMMTPALAELNLTLACRRYWRSSILCLMKATRRLPEMTGCAPLFVRKHCDWGASWPNWLRGNPKCTAWSR